MPFTSITIAYSLEEETHHFGGRRTNCCEIGPGLVQNGRFYTKDALSVWTNLGKHFVVRLVMRH